MASTKRDLRFMLLAVILAFGATVIYDAIKVYLFETFPNMISGWAVLFGFLGAIVILIPLFLWIVRRERALDSRS